MKYDCMHFYFSIFVFKNYMYIDNQPTLYFRHEI